MGNIIWLASYPKSGNTWCRAFLTNLMRPADAPADINDLETDFIASSRSAFDDLTGLEGSDLTLREVASLRPGVYRQLSEEATRPWIVKIHDAYVAVPTGEMLVPESATKASIYVIRSPLDVAVSLSHHLSTDLDGAIAWMANPHSKLAYSQRKLADQLAQPLLSWSQHVLSWVEKARPSPHVVRYEDMTSSPVETFTRIAQAIDLPAEREAVERALRFSDFAELQRQEQQRGFREKPSGMASFFRKGRVGAWRDRLSDAQAERVAGAHRDVMIQFGYLEPDGTIPASEGHTT